MNFIDILSAAPIAFFWSSVMAFIPIAFYMVMKGVGQEEERRLNVKIVFYILGICFLFYYLIFIVNYINGNPRGIEICKILSSLSIVAFWIAVIIYMPIAVFQGLKHALSFRTKATVKVIYLIFSMCLLVVAVLYTIHWLENLQTGIKLLDILTAIPIIFLASALLSVIPILIFAILKSPKPTDPQERMKQRANIMCLVYGGCLLIFCIIYAFNWMKNIQIEAKPFDVILIFLNLLYTSAIISFLPIQFYITIKAVMRGRDARKDIVFVIYCAIFVSFTTLYAFQWMENKKTGFFEKKESQKYSRDLKRVRHDR